jgi:hypothetical protein
VPETWSLTSRDEHRLRVFENKVLRRIFEPKKIKGVPIHAMKAHGGRVGIAPTHT